MITLPYEKMVEKIAETKGLSSEDIESKVKAKLDQLSGLISKEGAAHIVANELGVKLFEQPTGKVKIDKLMPGMRNIELVGKVTAIFEIREFSTERSSGKVGSFIVGDETGTTRITCWHDQTDIMDGLKQGDIVKISDLNVRENRGRIEAHTTNTTKCVKNPEGVSVDAVVPSRPEATRKKISELTDGDQNVEVLGTVVQSYTPTFFEVCPECGKRARPRDNEFVCEQHGSVTPTYSYVMNVFLDDGSQNIRTVCFRQQTEKLLGKSQEELLACREIPEKFEEMKHELLGTIVKAQGRVTRNAMFDRIELVVNDLVRDPDPEEELKRLNEN